MALNPRIFTTVVAVFVWLATTPGAGAAVFASDDRTAVPHRLQPVAEMTGLLFNNQSRTVCSAFCVADNLIATAAHCMARGQAAPPRYSAFRFARNFDRSRTFVQIEGATSGTAAQHVLTGDFKLSVRPPIDAASDWALVRVPADTCPVKSLQIRVLPLDEIIAEANAGRVFQIAYHRDILPWRPVYSTPCPVARDYDIAGWSAIAADFTSPEQMILHTCDTGGASSGSPLFLDTADGPVVIAMNVGTYVQLRMAAQGPAPARQKTEIVANTAINASAFATHVEMMRTAQILTASSEIRALQERLKSSQLYTGRLDGVYGPALKAAIETYEKTTGMSVIGLPTRSLVRLLAQDDARTGKLAPTSTEQPAPSR
jgi:Trypsin-like peptidase domain/Putative peptidoglycan binding domain